MNVCSYVKETMVNRRKSVDVNPMSTDSPCIRINCLNWMSFFVSI